MLSDRRKDHSQELNPRSRRLPDGGVRLEDERSDFGAAFPIEECDPRVVAEQDALVA